MDHLSRQPAFGDRVEDEPRRGGRVDIVIRHASGNQVRVQFPDAYYREFYDWEALRWRVTHWVVRR